MTTRKHLKRRVRSRVAQSGQPYATALREIRREQQESPMSGATSPIGAPIGPPTGPPSEDVIASCSFCGKPNYQVARIVAGPGVYICNECVELSATVIAGAAGTTAEESVRRRSQYLDRPGDEILAMLPALARSADRVEADLSRWVGRLREQGIDWPTIANALDMTVEGARQRFEAKPPA